MMTPTSMLARGALVAMLAALAACADEPEFRNRDISGAMPDLDFELERAPGGEEVTAEDYSGDVVALFFGYTNCPDYCPLTLSKYAAATDGLDDDLTDDLTFLFVSVDPERDTPQRLDDYVSSFGDQFVGLSADRPTLRDVTRRYRSTFSHDEPDDNGNYTVSHSTATYVFDRSGEIRLLVREDTPVEDLEHDLRLLLERG